MRTDVSLDSETMLFLLACCMYFCTVDAQFIQKLLRVKFLENVKYRTYKFQQMFVLKLVTPDSFVLIVGHLVTLLDVKALLAL